MKICRFRKHKLKLQSVKRVMLGVYDYTYECERCDFTVLQIARPRTVDLCHFHEHMALVDQHTRRLKVL